MVPSKLSSRLESSAQSTETPSGILLQIAKRLGCPLLTARLPCGTGEFRYRCFLPDLTGFAAPSCTGPNYQQSTSISDNRVRLNALNCFIARVPHVAERGGFEPPVLFWSTHDFQSCTFNRSVTSPCCNFRNLRALPCSTERQCLPNVSTGYFCDVSRGLSTTYHTELARAKSNCQVAVSYTIKTPAGMKKLCSIAMLCMRVSTMSPLPENNNGWKAR